MRGNVQLENVGNEAYSGTNLVTENAYERARSEILSQYSPRDIEAQKVLTRWLHDSGVVDHALKVGDAAPDFLLPDVDGRLVSSAELRRSGPLVVSFFRGDWCPFCTAELCTLQTEISGFVSMKATLLAITPDTRGYPRAFKRKSGFDFTILSDVDYGVSLSYGVVYSVPESLKSHLLTYDIDLSDRHGTKNWMLPVPATYIVDQDGVIRHAFVEPDFTIREDPQLILEALKAVVGSSRAGRTSE